MARAAESARITGIEHDAPLKARIDKLMMRRVKRAAHRPVRSVVAFFDDNGPKGGPAMRCALTVIVPRGPAIRVEHRAEDFDLAFRTAFSALERQVERYTDRERQDKRHPKKYYAARRATGASRSPRKSRRS